MLTCPRCNREIKPGVAFCMHCGVTFREQRQIVSALRDCPSCHVDVPMDSAFCTNCGYNMRGAAGAVFCPHCRKKNDPGMKFCGGCGYQMNSQPQHPQPYQQVEPSQPYQHPQPYQQVEPSQPYQQPQPYQQLQPYSQPQHALPYGQPQGYHQGQAPMVLRCPTCMATVPPGTQYCASCRTNLAGGVPIPAQGQQGGLGGFLQSGGGKLAVGALGGAAAVLGGQMLLHGIEERIEDKLEDRLGLDGEE